MVDITHHAAFAVVILGTVGIISHLFRHAIDERPPVRVLRLLRARRGVPRGHLSICLIVTHDTGCKSWLKIIPSKEAGMTLSVGIRVFGSL